MSEQRKGGWIQTYTGRRIWPMDMQPHDIDIVDIAHSLSNMCRYAGHCLRFYSVAEHSVLLSRYVKDNKMWALLHDASEYALVDVPSPVKPHLGGYKAAEVDVQRAVAKRFGLPPVIPDNVHEADKRITVDEIQQNMRDSSANWGLEPLGVTIECWYPARAKSEFLREFLRLCRPMDARQYANDNARGFAHAA